MTVPRTITGVGNEPLGTNNVTSLIDSLGKALHLAQPQFPHLVNRAAAVKITEVSSDPGELRMQGGSWRLSLASLIYHRGLSESKSVLAALPH